MSALRKKPRRNVRKAPAPAEQPSGVPLVLWLALALVTCSGAAWAAVEGFHALNERGTFQVRQVELTGHAHIPEPTLLSRVDLPDAIELYRVDLTQVSKNLLSHPWIERVAVRRIYPSTLHIRVWERTPEAVLTDEAGRELMVDDEGVILGKPEAVADGLPRLTGIPLKGLVAGSRVNVKQVRTGMAVARAYERTSPGATVRVDVEDPADPLLLADGLRVRMGTRGDYAARLERLAQLRETLQKMNKKRGVEVDLRLDDRVTARPL